MCLCWCVWCVWCTQLHSINIIIIDLFSQYISCWFMHWFSSFNLNFYISMLLFLYGFINRPRMAHSATIRKCQLKQAANLFKLYAKLIVNYAHLFRSIKSFQQFPVFQLHSNEQFSIIANEAIWMWKLPARQAFSCQMNIHVIQRKLDISLIFGAADAIWAYSTLFQKKHLRRTRRFFYLRMSHGKIPLEESKMRLTVNKTNKENKWTC